MNAALITELISLGLSQWADYQDRQAKGTLTDADVAAMLDALAPKLANFQAMIDAQKALKAA
jgi:hypothetical protein